MTPALSSEAGMPIHEVTLDNGLRVVVASNHRAPVVTHMLLIDAGAAADSPGASGVAHYLEHVLFKGTPNVPEGEYSDRIESLGGVHNAFTNADMTGYYVTIAREHLDTVMELEADRMQHLEPSDEAYLKERDVIIEERRLRVEVNPAALLDEAVRAALFPHHSYGTPIIGWLHEMEQLGRKEAEAFLKQYYAPNHATLLLVGDVTIDGAKTLARQFYGDWEASDIAVDQAMLRDPPVRASHAVTLRHVGVTLPRIRRAYVVPSIGDDPASASHVRDVVMPLLFAEELLGNTRTGVLYRRLVKEQQLASDVSVSYSPFYAGKAVLNVSITPKPNVDSDAVLQAYETALDEFLVSDIPKQAMTRAANQMKASAIFARDNLQTMSFILGQSLMIGMDPQWFNTWPNMVDGVTASDVQAALKTYVKHDLAVTGYLTPKLPRQEARQ